MRNGKKGNAWHTETLIKRIKQEEEEELALNQSNKSIQDMNDEM